MSSWIESIDVEAYVKQLMQQEMASISKVTQGRLDQLNNSEVALKTKISAYGQLQSLIDAFQQKLQALNTAFNPNFQVTTSDSTIATAAIDGTVSPGKHDLVVNQLAQAQRIASAEFASSTDDRQMTNTITFSVGSASFNVNVKPGDNLQTIASNINVGAVANNVGVFASIVVTGSNKYQLVLSSTQTGTANAVAISETGTGTNALNISTGVSGTGTVLAAAQDAMFTFDNLDYVLPTNSNLIAGLNVSLVGEGSTFFSVTQTDTVSNVNHAVEDSIDAYNQIMTYIAQAQVSVKLPDSILSLVQTSLANFMSNSEVLTSLGIVAIPYDEITAVPARAANGDSITIHPRGLLKISPDPITGETFSSKLTANFSGIQSELVGKNGIFTQMTTMLTPATGSIWKIMNDTQYGGLTLANSQVSQLDNQISDIKKNAELQKNNLILKYAQLDMVLSSLQVKSQYLSQQLAVMNNKTD